MTPMLNTALAMAGVLLIAVAIATRPWWRREGGRVQDRRAANVAAYRLRLAEIETEAAAGLIPADEADALRRELDARLLTDADAVDPALDADAGRRRPVLVAVVAVALTLFGAGWYLQRGGWEAALAIAATPPPAAPAAPTLDPEVAAMVDKLAERLRARPDDVQGWTMLGRSYLVMQRYADAAAAFAEVNRRAPPTADTLADEGEALAFAGGQTIDGMAAIRFDEALKLDPDHGKSLWYGGMAAVAAGDYALGRARWQRLLGQPDLDADMRGVLDERLAALDRALAEQGIAIAAAEPGAAPSVSASSTPPAPSPAPAASGPPVRLDITVRLAPELAAQVPAGATLFVFAKAVSGPPMPLAVQRLPLPTLPATITLDDSMAMAPGLALSAFPAYAITARLSAAGGAQGQAGDLEGSATIARPQNGPGRLEIVIDRIRK